MHTISLLLACAATAAPQYNGELLDFSASWCGPCQQMNPVVHALERQGLPIRQIDVDRNRALAQKYGVTNIPAFVLVVNGQAVDRVVGMTSESKLRAMIARIPRTQPAPAVARTTPSAPAATSTSTTDTADASGLGMPAEFPGTVRANNGEKPSPTTIGNTPKPYGASVRIRVVDEQGVNFGSGTIVESKPGRAVLLSCGHVFRDLAENSRIEVDVFQWDGKKIVGRETFVGKVIAYDMDSDVGLLSIPVQSELPVCPVARADAAAKVDDTVVSLGCSRGELPTRETIRVKQLNRYLGPDNLECTGVPVQGRSGGGLFNVHGEVVGICIARDPRDEEGIYAGLKAIHTLLDQQHFAHLYRDADDDATSTVTTGASPSRAVAALANSSESAGEVPADVARLLDDAGEAEVICIIRKHGEPESRSRVVIINRASSKFVSYLSNEVNDQPRLTSGHVGRSERSRTRSSDAPLNDARSNDARLNDARAKEARSMEQRLEGSGWQILRKPVSRSCEVTPERSSPSSPQRYRRSAASRLSN